VKGEREIVRSWPIAAAMDLLGMLMLFLVAWAAVEVVLFLGEVWASW
jgi:hypothetical protein